MSKNIVQYPRRWQIELSTYAGIFLKNPSGMTIAGYLRTVGIPESGRVWITRLAVIELIGLTICEELPSDHWFRQSTTRQKNLMVEFVLLGMAAKKAVSLSKFAERRGIPAKQFLYWAGRQEIRWLRSEVFRLRRDWTRMNTFLKSRNSSL